MARYDAEPRDAERLDKLITAAGLVDWMWMEWCRAAEWHLTGVHNARSAYKHKSKRDKVLKRWKQACPDDRRDVATRVEETLASMDAVEGWPSRVAFVAG